MSDDKFIPLRAERDSMAAQLFAAKDAMLTMMDYGKQLAEAKRQNAEQATALHIKDTVFKRLRREIEPLAAQMICPAHNTLSKQVNQIKMALALKPADCLAPVREALKEMEKTCMCFELPNELELCRAAQRRIGEEPAK